MLGSNAFKIYIQIQIELKNADPNLCKDGSPFRFFLSKEVRLGGSTRFCSYQGYATFEKRFGFGSFCEKIQGSVLIPAWKINDSAVEGEFVR